MSAVCHSVAYSSLLFFHPSFMIAHIGRQYWCCKENILPAFIWGIYVHLLHAFIILNVHSVAWAFLHPQGLMDCWPSSVTLCHCRCLQHPFSAAQFSKRGHGGTESFSQCKHCVAWLGKTQIFDESPGRHCIKDAALCPTQTVRQFKDRFTLTWLWSVISKTEYGSNARKMYNSYAAQKCGFISWTRHSKRKEQQKVQEVENVCTLYRSK